MVVYLIRSFPGTRITNLERENQDLANELHNEQKKVKKSQQARKVSEASVEALQQNLTDLHKDIGKLNGTALLQLCNSSVTAL